MHTITQGISIFFPCYNDAKSIQILIENAFVILKKLTPKYEVIIVDDNSTDNSSKVLRVLAKKYNKLKPIFHSENLGYGGALKSGFKAAKYDLVFYTDGDGQYDVKELPILLSLMNNDIDFVTGIKINRKDPTYRVIVGNIYSFLARWLFWLPVFDVDCDFRLIRRDLLAKLDLKNNSGSICIELVKKAQRAGGRFCQVSVHHYERSYGKSQFFQPRHLLKTFSELLCLWVQLMVVDKLFKKSSL